MSKISKWNLSDIRFWTLILTLCFFVKSLLLPSWNSTAEVLGSYLFSSYIAWLNTQRKQEINRKEFEEVQALCQSLKDQLNALRIKIGLQRG